MWFLEAECSNTMLMSQKEQEEPEAARGLTVFRDAQSWSQPELMAFHSVALSLAGFPEQVGALGLWPRASNGH